MAINISLVQKNNVNVNIEVCHPRCVGSITKNFCLLHIHSNTTIFNSRYKTTCFGHIYVDYLQVVI